jgi:hypothetical protein
MPNNERVRKATGNVLATAALGLAATGAVLGGKAVLNSGLNGQPSQRADLRPQAHEIVETEGRYTRDLQEMNSLVYSSDGRISASKQSSDARLNAVEKDAKQAEGAYSQAVTAYDNAIGEGQAQAMTGIDAAAKVVKPELDEANRQKDEALQGAALPQPQSGSAPSQPLR